MVTSFINHGTDDVKLTQPIVVVLLSSSEILIALMKSKNADTH